MKTKSTNFILISLSLLFLSCSTSYKLTKKASVSEAYGDYKSAATYFENALKLNRNKKSALIGFERNGLKVFKEYLDNFSQNYNSKNFNNAYDIFDEIISYYNKLNSYSIRPIFPSSVKENYQTCLSNLAEEHYKKGETSLNQGNYQDAVRYFTASQKYIPQYKDTYNKILEANNSDKLSKAESNYKIGLDYFNRRDFEKAIFYFNIVNENRTNYKDTNDLLQKAKNEQSLIMAEFFYTQGLNNMKNKLFKEAYFSFIKCLEFRTGYKDASVLKSEAFEKAINSVGIFPFENTSYQPTNTNSIIYSQVLSNIVNDKDPFIRIYDRNNLQRLLNERNLTSAGYIDPNFAVRNGKMLGLKFIITGSIVSINNNTQQPIRNILNVFTVWWYNDAGGYKIPSGIPTYIGHFQGHSDIAIDFQIQIIDVESGQIIDSHIFSSNQSDDIEYFETDVDFRNLSWNNPAQTVYYLFGIPGYTINWIDPSLFQNRKQLKSPQSMESEIANQISEDVTSYILSFLKQK